ncbi:MAG TPA: HEAT repeat domain-containing protein [Anaerohalosphaeraceae bacterium]|nr:HEAT repeat domain-containing protein [Anaerohalosphaeraceae bacterium]HOT72607.1 HEAT repeat domain-containing protein [Anaerohalosphaeraceae bacterium]HQG05644.1 HEAT repeat domain-containing protein [Anaerohalosphaeraceae bacterium]HQI07300.1 HEAT repeat domain-containing protein [Anaerohalosphaeraceae bacterium]HQJ67593.1 HEAT repeat domain-containing protein [Anaerohalosphaeraceae bacterium]
MKIWFSKIGLMVFALVCGCNVAKMPAQQNNAEAALETIQSLTPQALAVIKSGLDNSNSYVRTAAIEVAAQTHQEMFLPRIMQLADDPKVTVRFAALVAMGDMQCTSCRPTLLKKLEDKNPNVRIAAAYGLAKTGAMEYHEHIRKALRDSDPTVAANAALLIGKLGQREDLPLLQELMLSDRTTEKVLFQTVESMARLGDARVYRDKIWPLLISKYHDDRVWGIRCMGALKTPEAQMAVQTMLEDDVLEVRLAAAEQLAVFGDRSGVRLVRDYFQQRPNLDETTVANQIAVAAIGTLKDPSLNVYLPRALASKSPLIRLLAAKSVLVQQ